MHLPCHTEAWGEIILLRTPKRSSFWSQCRCRKVRHLRNGKKRSSVRGEGGGIVFPSQTKGDREISGGLPRILSEETPIGGYDLHVWRSGNHGHLRSGIRYDTCQCAKDK